MTRPIHACSAPRTAQAGLSLIIALLALVALSVASVALIRSVDTGTLVLGNLGFKQETTAQADQGTQVAIAWLTANGTSLTANSANAGYVAAAPVNFDPTLQLSSLANRVVVDWDYDKDDLKDCQTVPGTPSNRCLRPVAVTGNNNIRYIVIRLCQNVGAVEGNNCVRPAAQSSGDAADKGALDYSKPSPLAAKTDGVMYRVIVRAQGARDTTTFTETLVQL